jgi:hypothetical protein
MKRLTFQRRSMVTSAAIAIAATLASLGCASSTRPQPTISTVRPEEGTPADAITRWRTKHEGGCSLGSSASPFVHDGNDDVEGFAEEQSEHVKAIWAAIDGGLGDIQACYQQMLRRNAGLRRDMFLSGRVTCNFAIAPEGGVLWSNVQSTDVRSEWLKSCISAAICGWSFPPSPTNETLLVEYPMTMAQMPSAFVPRARLFHVRR